MAESIGRYTRLDYSVSMAKANIYSIAVAGPMIILLIVAYCGLWGFEKTLTQFTSIFGSLGRLIIAEITFLGVLAAGVVAHELIHAGTWVLASKKSWSAVRFGFQLSTLTPYAHCLEPMPIEAYRLGTLMPGLLTGLLPALIGTLFNNGWLAFMGGALTLAAGGDFLILLLIRKVARGALVEDHPSRAGCFVLEAKGE